MRRPFPLQWPAYIARTPIEQREPSRFTLGLAAAVDGLLVEMDRLHASNMVITSDLPTRADGRPYAAARASDPGIAVWFVLEGKERVLACDRWLTPAENLRAISSTISALRGIARWGSTEMTAQAFQGFTALPPGPTHWREILGVKEVSPTIDLVTANREYRRLSRAHHPDATESTAAEAQLDLNRAIAEARAELTPLAHGLTDDAPAP